QLLSLHADWAVEDDRAFRAAARQALAAAEEYDVLVTVGVKPTRNETGYGYIVPGKPLGGARGVRRFVEKPSPARAALLRQRGALWNAGLFAWGVARFLGEAGAYARELKPGWPALAAGDIAGFFGAVRPVAVDVAVLERTKRLAVVAGTFRWDDIGSWDALLRIRKPDARGNVVVGNVTLADDVRRSVVWSDSEHLAVIGLEDMVVVRANGHTLVMPTGRAERLKQLVQRQHGGLGRGTGSHVGPAPAARADDRGGGRRAARRVRRDRHARAAAPRRPARAARRRRPDSRGQHGARRPQRDRPARRGGRAGGGIRRPGGSRRARERGRGPLGDAAGGTRVGRGQRPRPGRLRARDRDRPALQRAGRGVELRVPGICQQGPRRLRGPFGDRPLGEPRRRHDHVEPEEHVRPRPARRRGHPARNGSPAPGQSHRRPRQDGDRNAARNRDGRGHRGQRVRRGAA